MKTLSTLIRSFIFLSFAFLLLACGPSFTMPKSSMPPGASFSGLWYSNFGDLKLTQTDDTIRGTFDHRTGGEVFGKVEGGVFSFTWIQPGDFAVGRREVSGHGYLVMSADGLNLDGEWGYAENYTGGGKWEARKATVIYEDVHRE